MRKENVFEIIKLHQGNISVKEYALNLTQLYKYAPTMVVDPRKKMSKFVSGVSEMMVKECRTTMFVNDMDIYHVMVHAQKIEEEKLKEKSKETKRPKPIMVISLLQGPMDIVVLDVDKGFPVKVPLILLIG